MLQVFTDFCSPMFQMDLLCHWVVSDTPTEIESRTYAQSKYGVRAKEGVTGVAVPDDSKSPLRVVSANLIFLQSSALELWEE
jgi:hypothetical protein